MHIEVWVVEVGGDGDVALQGALEGDELAGCSGAGEAQDGNQG
jgi:hypothetical protein